MAAWGKPTKFPVYFPWNGNSPSSTEGVPQRPPDVQGTTAAAGNASRMSLREES
jgi:hypothetical protein